jgi:hypothetical protein
LRVPVQPPITVGRVGALLTFEEGRQPERQSCRTRRPWAAGPGLLWGWLGWAGLGMGTKATGMDWDRPLTHLPSIPTPHTHTHTSHKAKTTGAVRLSGRPLQTADSISMSDAGAMDMSGLDPVPWGIGQVCVGRCGRIDWWGWLFWIGWDGVG